MSYDLYLRPQSFDADAINSWLGARPNFGAADNPGAYTNEDTGVSFTFAVEDDATVAVNINYFRPHIFGLEADIELCAFTQHFACKVDDPQGGMGETYSSEGFLSGWNAGNRAAFEIMAGRGEVPLAADPALIEAAWLWNRKRAAMQAEAGDKVFVPKVCWVQPTPGEAPLACVTWTWGIPVVIPESLISRIVLVRDRKPGLMEMFSRKSQRQAEFKLLDVEGGIRLRSVEATRIGRENVLLAPATGSLEVQTLFMGNWEPTHFRIVPADQVCGADLTALARG